MTAITDYIKSLDRELAAGRATEHTHRPALKALIEALAPGVLATNEPRRVACGAPDYVVARAQTPLGYVEAKDLDKSLDEAERSPQMARYLESLGNLVLTNYLEFRWYVGGEHRLTARLGALGANGKVRPERGGAEQAEQLLRAFLAAQTPTVATAQELARRMAALACLMRDSIAAAFAGEDLTDDRPDPLHEQLEGFRRVLLHDLTPEQFADMYAQTICYGLFAARCNQQGPGPFTRQHAAWDLPKTNPFLRWLFGLIVGPDMDERIVWAVDDLAELLNRTDMAAIMEDFGQERAGRDDPVIHFYETFLAAYDPQTRETRGVFYTPKPMVSYIVRSVHHLLKSEFDCPAGLADSSVISIPNRDPNLTVKGSREMRKTTQGHRVLILDPATGTATFPHDVIACIHAEIAAQGQGGAWSSYVSQHLLPRLYGFELLMAPYAMAHMKLGLQLAQSGYDFGSNERLRIYLTNTLDEPHEWTGLPLFTQELAREAQAANQVKRDLPIMVVLGNPPYSGHSANKGRWIVDLLHGKDSVTNQPTGNYFQVDGQPLGEKNPKWLNDDYVKFIRFAQWRIEQTGHGILAFITNHGYLDNPTFRGMRQSLLQTFDQIYILDLHGNSKKRERCPDGSPDENVFDIQQGVAIGIFVRRPGGKRRGATVQHAHLWGLREVYGDEGGDRILVGGKYHWLWEHDVASTEWTTVVPEKPFYLFVPQDTHLRSEYDRGWQVQEIMPINSMGVTTGRDSFATAFSLGDLEDRISTLRGLLPDEEIRVRYGLKDSSSFSLQTARTWSRRPDAMHSIVPFSYRCFDERFLIYSPAILARSRQEIFQHLIGKTNLALVTFRAIRELPWAHAFVARNGVAKEFISSLDNCFVFPMYLYPSHGALPGMDLSGNLIERQGNISNKFVNALRAGIGLGFIPNGKGDLAASFGPEDILHYLYAILHSPTYRRRYAEFLKIDFPRLPLTSNVAVFRALCTLGGRLVGLHLLEVDVPLLTRYPQSGDSTVDRVRYDEVTRRMWINGRQYFEGVPPEVWGFQVGGYQVCEKWLKDRKGRQLTYDDLTHYQRIVAALADTIRCMGEIDAAIDGHGGWPIG